MRRRKTLSGSYKEKVKKPKSVRELHPRAYTIAENIIKIGDYNGVSEDEICASMNVNINTFRRRMAAPYDFTLAEIDNIVRALGTTYEMLYKEKLTLS